jgi:hypothetical protein
MKIKRVGISVRTAVLAADTSKADYVVKVRKLLNDHDHKGTEPYIKRAQELFLNESDSESLLPILISA